MRYVAAYCLAALGSKNPSVKDIETILSSVGIDCDDDKAQAVVSELEGKKLNELFSQGKAKLGSVPAGGGAAAGGASRAAPAAAAAETKKEPEKEPEPEEESDDDMGFGLFD